MATGTKYIFVTGGVVSGLGKGIAAASLGRLLKQRGLRVKVQKLDPYLNVDPGTMSPYQHGEVFVTDDGAETDLDLGHYERFIDENLTFNSSVSSGKVYWNVLNRERAGDYLGATVQIIPHITNATRTRGCAGRDGWSFPSVPRCTTGCTSWEGHGSCAARGTSGRRTWSHWWDARPDALPACRNRPS